MNSSSSWGPLPPSSSRASPSPAGSLTSPVRPSRSSAASACRASRHACRDLLDAAARPSPRPWRRRAGRGAARRGAADARAPARRPGPRAPRRGRAAPERGRRRPGRRAARRRSSATAMARSPSRSAPCWRARSRSRVASRSRPLTRSTSSSPRTRLSASASLRPKSRTSAVTRAPRSSVRRSGWSSGSSARSTSVPRCSSPGGGHGDPAVAGLHAPRPTTGPVRRPRREVGWS